MTDRMWFVISVLRFKVAKITLPPQSSITLFDYKAQFFNIILVIKFATLSKIIIQYSDLMLDITVNI